MNSTLAENLKKIRKKHKLSQEDLASILGVSRQAISKWESKVAYPEMDKIMMLCNKFNLNIDDLLHKDIEAIEDKKISKKVFDNYLDKVFNSITDSIELFYRMTLKSKVKLIFETIIIISILFIIWLLGAHLGDFLVYYLLKNINHSVYKFIYNTLGSLYLLLGLLFNLIIIIKLYKSRYLSSYQSVLKEKSLEDSKSLELIKTPRIIIKNTSSNDDYFFEIIYNLLKGIIKGIAFFLVVLISIGLVLLCISLMISFLITKSGLFFIGVLGSIISLSVISIMIILVLLNFIFSRTSNMKIIINMFLISLIIFGISSGLAITSILNFKDSLTNFEYVDTKDIEVSMDNNLSLNNLSKIEYIEDNRDNLRIEYQINKACTLDYLNIHDSLKLYSRCSNKKELFKELLNSLNNQEIYNFEDTIHEISNIKVYASPENIEVLKENSK